MEGLKLFFMVPLFVWSVYAFFCEMNHAGVWPFSHLGAG